MPISKHTDIFVPSTATWRRWLFVLVWLLVATVGCFDLNAPGESLQFEFGVPVTGDPNNVCATALDCPLRFVCVDAQCAEGCRSNIDCPSGELCLGSPAECVVAGECSFDQDCGDGERCHPALFSCVSCLDDFDCTGDLVCRITPECTSGVRPCTVEDFSCSGCSRDSECAVGSVCDTPTGRCVECNEDLDCPFGLVCDPDQQLCTRCITDDDCSGNPLLSACFRTETGGECVGCVDDEDCPEGTCNRDTLICEGCRSNNDCGDGLMCNSASGLCYDTTCTYRDASELIELTVETLIPTPHLAGPLVAGPLVDDNNSGVLDAADRAELIIPLTPQDPSDPSTLAINLDQRRLWTASALAGATLGAAMGDIDGDSRPDTVALRGDRLVAHNTSGSTLWTSGSRTSHLPGLFDIDRDGFAEIVAGNSVFSEAGSRIWVGSAHTGGHADLGLPGLGIAAELDGDAEGGLEIVAGGTIYSTLGEVLCTEGDDGYAAVADIVGDAAPEIVVVSSDGSIRALSTECALLWGPVAPEGASAGGGPPAIADTDGDGQVEIVYAAGSRVLAALDGEGQFLWFRPLDDAHPAAGVSIADLNGDGNAELLISDQSSVKVFRASDGFLLTEHPQGASLIGLSAPLVLDVDGDGAAEIVVGSGFDTPEDQVVVLGDVRDRWAEARNIWNQTAYIPAAVGDGLTIPTVLPLWWEQNNRVRAQETGRDSEPAPNLVLGEVLGSVELGDCPDRYSIAVGLSNRGATSVPVGVMLDARFITLDTGPLVEVTSTTRLDPGDRETIVLTFDDLRGPVDIRLQAARPDADQALLPECSLDDNVFILEGIGCPDTQ